MRNCKVLTVCAVACALALLAAACGDSDDDSGRTTSGDSGSAIEEAFTPEELDAEFGLGAAAFREAMRETEDEPLVAEGEAFVISMPNHEGDAAGSFPEMREGAEALVDLINERLGGVGADYENGVPGRPIELLVCSSGLTPEEAQSCANEVAGQNPNVVVIGTSFFGPAIYPTISDFPIINSTAILVADYQQPGAVTAGTGCPTQFFGAANYIADVGFDRVAVIHDDGPVGVECWEDTTERPLRYFADQGNLEFEGFANTQGDTSDDAATFQQVARFLEGAENPAVMFGPAPSDCINWATGLRATGVDVPFVLGHGCNDEAVLELPEVVGAVVEIPGYNPTGDLGPFESWELDVRAAAIEAYGPDSSVNTLMFEALGHTLWAWQVANYMIDEGLDPDDRAEFTRVLEELPPFHVLGQPAIDCSTSPAEYLALCNRRTAWLEWDGERFGPGAASFGAQFFDVTDLMDEVATAYPR